MVTRAKIMCPVEGCGRMYSPQGMYHHAQAHERGTVGKERVKNPNPAPRPGWDKSLNDYLKAIHNGKQVKPNRVKFRVEQINQKIEAAEEAGLYLKAIRLTQLRINLEEIEEGPDLEAAFIEKAKAFADANGISARVWKEIGVPVRVLKKAGIR